MFVLARPSPQPSPKGRGRQKNRIAPLTFRRFLLRPAVLLLVPLALIALASLTRALNTPALIAAHAQTLRDQQLDLLILHGKLVDGAGSKPRKADVGIRGDRITFVGDARKANLTAARILDATGLVVAPGFIDPHTHTLGDLSDEKRKSNEPYLMQGVTTVVTGNDGGSVVNVGEILRKWDEQGIGTNAVGWSTGFYYAPGSYARTEEVIELSKVAAAKGGIYDTHMRDESSYSIGLLGSIKETIRIGREAKIPVHISHIKALGPEVWGQSKPAIELIKKARAEGIEASACQYPYDASGTTLAASLVPRWAEVGGRSELLKRIEDPQVRPRLLAEMEENLKRRGGADSLLITDARNPQLVGKRLSEIARAQNKSPVEMALELIKTRDLAVASFNMNEKDIDRFMKQSFITTCSDGSAGHPRKYGTFPRKLREYVYNRKLIGLSFAVRNSSALTAETFRIPERGLIREGYFADVIIFDEKTVADRATYEQPELFSVGMKFVIVNGKVAVENGAYTGALAGRALRKQLPQTH